MVRGTSKLAETEPAHQIHHVHRSHLNSTLHGDVLLGIPTEPDWSGVTESLYEIPISQCLIRSVSDFAHLFIHRTVQY